MRAAGDRVRRRHRRRLSAAELDATIASGRVRDPGYRGRLAHRDALTSSRRTGVAGINPRQPPGVALPSSCPSAPASHATAQRPCHRAGVHFVTGLARTAQPRFAWIRAAVPSRDGVPVHALPALSAIRPGPDLSQRSLRPRRPRAHAAVPGGSAFVNSTRFVSAVDGRCRMSREAIVRRRRTWLLLAGDCESGGNERETRHGRSARPRSAYARAGPGEAWPRGCSSSGAAARRVPLCGLAIRALRRRAEARGAAGRRWSIRRRRAALCR
jgi:hypothetical protein